MSCEKQLADVNNLKEQLADAEANIKGATGQQLHMLAAQIGGLRSRLSLAEAALFNCVNVFSGTVIPNYQLLFVMYAPPGTDGGKGSSTVDYFNGSTMGSSTSTSSSYQTGLSISGSVGVDVKVFSSTLAVGFDVSDTSTDSSSLEVTKSKSLEIKAQGPAKNGIDHDHDVYYLCLKPALHVVIIKGQKVTWGYDPAFVPVEIVFVYGGQLRNPATMPAGLQARLTKAGLTEADYKQILAANPFSLSSSAAIDPKRFLPTDQTIPYLPPLTANDPLLVTTYIQKNETKQTSSEKWEQSYGVNFSVEAGGGFLDIFKASLKTSTTFKWTNSSTSGTSTDSSQSASASISGPSFGYQGPIDVLVYWDTLFKTFLFAFADSLPVSSGHVKDRAGHPVIGKEVVLTAGNRTFRTFTDNKGEFRFYGPVQGASTVFVGDKTLQMSHPTLGVTLEI